MTTAVLGAILWILFLEQLYLVADWPMLRAWQSRFAYKTSTGAVLGLFIAFQWLLAACRASGSMRAAKVLHSWHRILGATAPILLFLHSTRLGFGYLLVLSAVYIANGVLGLAGPPALPQRRGAVSSWTVTHIALSVVLAALAGYHAWTALYYE